MAILRSFNLSDFVDSLVSLSCAFVLGTLIGAERQFRQRGGGLRTHVLVAVGAATFVDSNADHRLRCLRSRVFRRRRQYGGHAVVLGRSRRLRRSRFRL